MCPRILNTRHVATPLPLRSYLDLAAQRLFLGVTALQFLSFFWDSCHTGKLVAPFFGVHAASGNMCTLAGMSHLSNVRRATPVLYFNSNRSVTVGLS